MTRHCIFCNEPGEGPICNRCEYNRDHEGSDEETISALTEADCRRLFGEQLTETISDPFGKRFAA